MITTGLICNNFLEFKGRKLEYKPVVPLLNRVLVGGLSSLVGNLRSYLRLAILTRS